MRKIFIALSLTAFALTSTSPAYAASHAKEKMAACKPAKKGFHLNAQGKCVKIDAMKKNK